MKVFSLHFAIFCHPKQMHYAYSEVTSRGRGEKKYMTFFLTKLGGLIVDQKG